MMMIEFVHVGLNAREGPLQATEINTKNLLIKSIKNSSIIRTFNMNELIAELSLQARDLSFDQFHNNNCIFSISHFQVTDSNDNPPVFSEPAYSFDIPENAPRGYQVGLISASDPDLGANSMLTYTVISDWANDVFSLNPQTGVFTLTARLDYEEVSNALRCSHGSVNHA